VRQAKAPKQDQWQWRKLDFSEGDIFNLLAFNSFVVPLRQPSSGRQHIAQSKMARIMSHKFQFYTLKWKIKSQEVETRNFSLDAIAASKQASKQSRASRAKPANSRTIEKKTFSMHKY